MRHVFRARTRRALSAAAVLAVAAAGQAGISPAGANTAGTGLVISEVYGAGGNSGSTYNADFVELYNPTAAPISVAGDYIHYRSAGGGSGGTPAALTGSVPAHGHYLIQMSAPGSNGIALPTPDAGPFGFTMAAAGGQIFLLAGSTPITTSGDMAGVAGVVDMVGASGSSSYETAPAGAATTASSLQRNDTGVDSDNNSADLAVKTVDPQNTTSGGGGTPDPTVQTIAEIQGTDTDTSPFVGKPVTTTGVVTATYPSGGFFGYVLQTDGTGTGADATPGASDAVYVYQPAGAVTATIGHSLTVTGTVSEFKTSTSPRSLTELTVPAAGVVDNGPAATGVTALETAYPTTDAGREAHESELLSPTDRFTVTDNYSTNQYGEIGLATGDHQLWQPTDLSNPNLDPAGIAAVQADNAARKVTLDDGASTSFLNSSTPMSWLTPDNPVRIGSSATLHEPVVLDYRNGLWKLQPTTRVTGAGTDVATFSDTRSANQTPQPVGGDLKLGTFNVLNYFNTTGMEWVSSGHTCTFYDDRAGSHVTDKECSDNGPRGAAESSGGDDLTAPTADLERQRTKEVEAINTMDADILSLEEIENSVALGEGDRDDALTSLVDALNADAGHTRWAYAPSPAGADLPPTGQQDVIRTAFIYNPDTVSLVGPSQVLSDLSDPGEAFANAREPLAQEFKRKGAFDSDGFLVVVNHFKSKGDSDPKATGDNADGLQGAFNGDRVRQARAVVDFAHDTAAADGIRKVFLVGDFNSYTHEDPMQVLYGAGYVNQASDDPRDTSYEFGGMAGSLDHVLANTAAANLVTGRDVWQINAEESVGFEYSRYNYNATLLYQPNQFRASDHNPELVGLSVPFTRQDSTVAASASPSVVQKKKGSATVTATVTGAQGVTPTGTVQFWIGGRQVATADLVAGSADAVVGPFPSAGTQTVEVRYSGDQVTEPSTTTVTITVSSGAPK
jgi:predicted extracellular nuclease